MEFCKTDLEKIYGIEIEHESLFKQALTHTSYTGENSIDIIESYERLEFLGDAVLKLFMSDYLYKKYSDFREGEMTKMRGVLVSDATLAKLGVKIGLDKLLILGKQEEKTGGRKKTSIVACAFEAILGAYYLSGKTTELFSYLEKIFKKEVEDLSENLDVLNAKSILQEYTQAKNKDLPSYKVVETKGPEHDKIFVVEVSYNGNVLAKGEGKNKKEAEINSAYEACKLLGITKNR
ncbi:MAG: ribonuclease III [bacterium]|nr:ribonuclease III [bacterium]